MIEWLAAKVGITVVSTLVSYGIGGALLIIVLFVLKRVPNNKIRGRWGVFMYSLGVGFTLGGSQWVTRFGKVGKKIWQVVEDYVLDFIENIVVFGIAEFVRGGRSDNMSLKESIKVKHQTQVDTKNNITIAGR